MTSTEILSKPSQSKQTQQFPDTRTRLENPTGIKQISDARGSKHIQGEDIQEESQKRKRTNETPPSSSKKFILNEGQKIKQLIEQAETEVKKMSEIIKAHINTKKGIKDSIIRLGSIINQLKTDRLQKWLKTNEDSAQKVDKSVQTTKSTHTELASVRRTEISPPILEGDIPWETAKDIIHTKWPESWYKNTKNESGSPILPSGERDTVILIDPREDNHVTKKLKERGYIRDILSAGKPEPTKIAYLLDTKEAVIEGEEVSNKTRRYTYLAGIRSDSEVNNYQEAYYTLKKVVEKAEINGSKGLTVMLAKDQQWRSLRNLLECILTTSYLQAVVYTTRKQKDETEIDSPMKDELWEKPKKKNRGILKETIIINPTNQGVNGEEEMSFAAIVKQVKDQIDIDKTGVRVRTVKQTRSGGVKIEVTAKEEGKGQQLREEITKILQERASADIVASKKAILFKNLDDLTTKEDVIEAIRINVPQAKDATLTAYVTKGKFRNSATVWLAKDVAFKLIQMRKMKIGWVYSTIEEKIVPTRCYNCHKFGHIARNCKEEKVITSKCMKCCQEGHKALDCPNNEFCLTCNKSGHRTDTMRCPKFKDLVNELKKKKVRLTSTT